MVQVREDTPEQKEQGQNAAGQLCLNCGKKPIEYQAVGCAHPSLCKSCGMKMATGGVCKACGERFYELQRTG